MNTKGTMFVQFEFIVVPLTRACVDTVPCWTLYSFLYVLYFMNRPSRFVASYF